MSSAENLLRNTGNLFKVSMQTWTVLAGGKPRNLVPNMALHRTGNPLALLPRL